MKYYLDGSDWEADYFISNEECVRWQMASWNLHNMFMDNAGGAGFTDTQSDYQASYQATVPGCDRSVLLQNGVIDDPFFGRNMDHSRWSEKASWGFRKRFMLPVEMAGKKHFQLRFCGIDYSAAFYFNGQYLGSHTGAFVPFEADVTDYIFKDRENMIAVVFDPMPQALPNHTDPFNQKPAEFADFHRSQLSYGWDWARAMAAVGIWDHVYLNGCDDVRVADCFFRGNAAGEVNLELDFQCHRSGQYPFNISLKPLNFAGAEYHFEQVVALEYGACSQTLQLNCPNPELWYPNGYGRPNLYELILEIDGEVTRKQVAFRSLKMQRNANSPEGAYDLTFVINGQAVFARGSNWVPSDMMYCRSGEAEYERLVRLAAENHTNLFRIWGGGIIEKDEFYAACDRYGIMVWQEFMHACSSYRKDPEYLAFKAREANAILRKIRNHVCISMLCGGNEMLYYGEIPDSPLLKQYQQIAAVMTPDLPYHTTCPDRSRPGERDHGPWHFVEHTEINKHDRLLASEIGCPGFTEFESVKKFIPQAEWEKPFGQSWKYHFAIPRGAQGWPAEAAVFDPRNSAEICQATMACQSNINCYWINHCRRKYPHTSGCFIWQYNEPWPTLSLSLIDYYTLPKMAYYHLMRIQQNVALSLREESWFCKNGKFAAELFLCSDLPTGKLESSFRLLTLEGQELCRNIFSSDGRPGSVKLGDVTADLPENPTGGVVLAEMRVKCDNEVIFTDTQIYGVPDFKQIFTAPAAEIEVETAVRQDEKSQEKILQITLQCRSFAAVNLRLNLADCSLRNVYWHDNYVTLVPGERRVITANITGEVEQLGNLELSAWNMPLQKIAAAAN